MSQILESEIKSMTKEQNYLQGYKDGKSDVLDKIRAEICKTSAFYHGTELSYGLDLAIKIVDKYKAESEENHADHK